MLKFFNKFRCKSSSSSNESINLLSNSDDSLTQHPPFEEVPDPELPSNGGSMYTFSYVTKNERKLSHSDIQRFANIYADELLDLYKTTFTSSGPLFTYNNIYTRLIDALPDSTIRHLKLFRAVGMHRNERPTISFANHCEFRMMECLVLNYQRSFIQHILPRLTTKVQYILLTVFCDVFVCPKEIDFVQLSTKFHSKYPNIKNVPFVLLLSITHNYKPKILKATVTEDIEYDHTAF